MRAAYRHGGWVIAVAVLLLNVLHAYRHDHLNAPPETGDGVDYDSIGLNLARGRGFGYFRGDPEWRAPYEAAIQSGQRQYAELLKKTSPFELTTYRPPLFPALLAGIYATVGRHFVIWRVASCFMAAAAAFFMFGIARRLGGTAAGWIAGGLFLIDPYQRHLAGTYLTEGLATLLVVLLLLVTLEVIERPRPRWFAAFGLVIALAVLTRGIFIFLLPLAGLIAIWKGWTERQREGWTGLALFLLVTGLLLAPWWTRNCVVLDAPMPFGSQGWINMPAGYNDHIIDNRGVWDRDLRNDLYAEGGFILSQDRPRLEWERMKANDGRELTMRWIRENPEKLPMVFFIKILTLWGSSRFGIAAMAIAAIGLGVARPLRSRLPLYALLLVYSAGVGLTWTTGGRFRIPMMPVVFILAADTLVAIASRVGWLTREGEGDGQAAAVGPPASE